MYFCRDTIALLVFQLGYLGNLRRTVREGRFSPYKLRVVQNSVSCNRKNSLSTSGLRNYVICIFQISCHFGETHEAQAIPTNSQKRLSRSTVTEKCEKAEGGFA